MPLMTWPDLLGRDRPQADHRVAYGALPQQIVDVWLPAGPGPHPTVLMVHGGCWTKAIADLSIMNYIAADLRAHGVAVWNIEYRGVDEDGGGYPGTFADVAAAADALRDNAARFALDIEPLVAHGHSAGGHLASWLAARARLPDASPLPSTDPIAIARVVNVGGLADLDAAKALGDQSCGAEVIDSLGAAGADPFADISLTRLLPTGAGHDVVNTAHDRIAPPWFGAQYTDKLIAAGDAARFHLIPDAAHVELIAPDTPAWAAQRAIILDALGLDALGLDALGRPHPDAR
ncbi:MAG: alpha/beta hydrolase fold domain-containing protein [Alphaproteobacteria bacterium]|nr:alpha/beta hydrolase fold domain-containing protein [Alphaproteobacteria bacterium]